MNFGYVVPHCLKNGHTNFQLNPSTVDIISLAGHKCGPVTSLKKMNQKRTNENSPGKHGESPEVVYIDIQA